LPDLWNWLANDLKRNGEKSSVFHFSGWFSSPALQMLLHGTSAAGSSALEPTGHPPILPPRLRPRDCRHDTYLDPTYNGNNIAGNSNSNKTHKNKQCTTITVTALLFVARKLCVTGVSRCHELRLLTESFFLATRDFVEAQASKCQLEGQKQAGAGMVACAVPQQAGLFPSKQPVS
jgi:hypothetical protein